MAYKHNKTKKSNSKKYQKKGSKNKSGKHWITAISAAQKELISSGSISKAKKTLRKQALINARKLFGSVGEIL
jgi:hypothetical protein